MSYVFATCSGYSTCLHIQRFGFKPRQFWDIFFVSLIRRRSLNRTLKEVRLSLNHATLTPVFWFYYLRRPRQLFLFIEANLKWHNILWYWKKYLSCREEKQCSKMKLRLVWNIYPKRGTFSNVHWPTLDWIP